MKKLFTIVAMLLGITLGASAQTNDTVTATIKNVVFTMVSSFDKGRTYYAEYAGKKYETYAASEKAYRRQIRYFGDCRVLIVNNKMIVL